VAEELRPENYVNVILEEYKTLREESKQASINMFTSLSIGLGVVGVVTAGAFSLWNTEPLITLVALYVLTPLFILTATFLWLGEAMRFKRVGDYICLIEAKLSMLFSDCCKDFKERWQPKQSEFESKLRFPHTKINFGNVLGWEQWLRDMVGESDPFGHFALIYKIRLIFFIMIFLASFSLGVYLTFVSNKWTKGTTVGIISLGFFYLILWIFVYLEARKLHNKPEALITYDK